MQELREKFQEAQAEVQRRRRRRRPGRRRTHKHRLTRRKPMKKPRGRIGEASRPGPKVDHRNTPSPERPPKIILSSAPPRVRLVGKRSRQVYLRAYDSKDDAPVPKQEKASGSTGQDRIEIEDQRPDVQHKRSRSQDPVAYFLDNA